MENNKIRFLNKLIKRNLRLGYDKIVVIFNPKYLEGDYFLQNNSDGVGEIFVNFKLKLVLEGPLTVSFLQLYFFHFCDQLFSDHSQFVPRER
jgi:hypothetical protein